MESFRKSAAYLSGISATTSPRAPAPKTSPKTLSTLRSTGPRTRNLPAKRAGKGRTESVGGVDRCASAEVSGAGLRIVVGRSGVGRGGLGASAMRGEDGSRAGAGPLSTSWGRVLGVDEIRGEGW